MWPETIAAIALGDPARYADGFFETTGREAGTGAYTSWLAKGFDPRIGAAAVWSLMSMVEVSAFLQGKPRAAASLSDGNAPAVALMKPGTPSEHAALLVK
jgi:hypothetical protein